VINEGRRTEGKRTGEEKRGKGKGRGAMREPVKRRGESQRQTKTKKKKTKRVICASCHARFTRLSSE